MREIVLATSGGPHPPIKWAECTAQCIVEGDSPEADKAKTLIRNMLVVKYNDLQHKERERLQAKNDPEPDSLLDREWVESTLYALSLLMKGGPHELHFSQDHVLNYLYRLLSHHSATVKDIERKWHADRLRG